MSGAVMSFGSSENNLLGVGRQQIPLRERIGAALRAATEHEKSAAKLLARATGRTPAMAEKWLRGENSPNAEALAALMRAYDEVWEVMLAETGRSNEVEDAGRLFEEFAERWRTRRR